MPLSTKYTVHAFLPSWGAEQPVMATRELVQAQQTAEAYATLYGHSYITSTDSLKQRHYTRQPDGSLEYTEL